MTALLEIVKNQKIEGFTDKLVYGGQILLIGMATVFAVLILIWLCLVLFKLAFHDLPQKRKEVPAPVQPAPTVPAAPVVNDNSEEIVAVIAAAIAAAESECSGLKFKVVSFRRK